MKIKPKLSYSEQLSLRMLEKFNVILLNDNSFLNLNNSLSLANRSSPLSLVYKRESTLKNISSQLSLKCIQTFSIDPILSKFIT